MSWLTWFGLFTRGPHVVHVVKNATHSRTGGMEPLLFRCLVSLAPLLARDGIIMDAGANDGQTTVLLARQFATRRIVSLEPIFRNVEWARQRVGHEMIEKERARVSIMHGGLGAKRGTSSYPSRLDRMTYQMVGGASGVQTGALPNYRNQRNDIARTEFVVFTVDDLLHERGETLALAHWDVEGHEKALLEGARRTILRDQPIFTLEAFPKSMPSEFRQLVTTVASLHYRMLELPERCGMPSDCRNYVCVPARLWDRMRSDAHGCHGSEPLVSGSGMRSDGVHRRP
mgnify:CR=1 FL=1